MSWMRLLAVGRSIKPMASQAGKYRISAPMGLPRFGGGRKVRQSAGLGAAPPRERAPESASRNSQFVGLNTPQRKVAQAPARVGWAIRMIRFFRNLFFGKDPKMNSLDAGSKSTPAATFEVPAQAYPLGRWTLFKNPFAKRSKPVETATPVQGELLLDMVKPIRNDLVDSDLEVVPRSAVAVSASAPAKALSAKASSPEVGLGSAAPGSSVASASASAAASVPASASVGPALEDTAGDLAGHLAARSRSVAVETSGAPAWGRVKDEFFGVGQP